MPATKNIASMGIKVIAYTQGFVKGLQKAETKTGIDKMWEINVHFHKRRLTEDQDLFVREGVFILYGDTHYEITTLNEPRQLFGQTDHKMEIEANCIKSRRGLFDAT